MPDTNLAPMRKIVTEYQTAGGRLMLSLECGHEIEAPKVRGSDARRTRRCEKCGAKDAKRSALPEKKTMEWKL